MMTKPDYMRLAGMRVAFEGVSGAIWAPAPLTVRRRLLGRRRRMWPCECACVAMSDGYFWHVVLNLITWEVLHAEPTGDRCMPPPAPARPGEEG